LASLRETQTQADRGGAASKSNAPIAHSSCAPDVNPTAAARARSGQSPPVNSASASNGSQMSAACGTPNGQPVLPCGDSATSEVAVSALGHCAPF
jgi:hypothetical protein